MNKKLNKYIKEIEICENIIPNLNKKIEKYFVNCSVLLFIDYLTYQKYESEILQLKHCSLNNIEIKVLFNKEIDFKINETFSLVVGVGGNDINETAKNFAIKNNICYGLVCLNGLKCEVLCKNNQNLGTFYSALFVFIDKSVENDEFKLKCNIYKYAYLFLENYLFKEDNLEKFIVSYMKIINNLNKNNLVKSVIGLGVLLNKFNIKFFNGNYDEFNKFALSENLILIYENIFKNLNKNNLYLNRLNNLNFEELKEYNNFDYKFNKFYLLCIKSSVLFKIEKIKKLFVLLLKDIKTTNIKLFYKKRESLKNINFVEEIFNNKETLFLKKMQNFKAFSVV